MITEKLRRMMDEAPAHANKVSVEMNDLAALLFVADQAKMWHQVVHRVPKDHRCECDLDWALQSLED